jgi:Asp-tRNA(Asn)/Glu-tRNA(Gln) amidotransferase C subunit
MKGITKVIDEMGLMILTKEIELELKEKEINELKKKIELIEGYLEMYDEFYNNENK